MLNLFYVNISGQIPPAIGRLPFLETLVLTNLTGQTPPALTNFTRLKLLRLSYTNLMGPISAFLTHLQNLTFLNLSYNDLSVPIPPSLSDLQNLDALHLSRNRLTGTVPRALGVLKFQLLDFLRNKLEGDISFLFRTNKTLQIANFSRNVFGFDLTKVEFPVSLTSLDLSHNMINGSLAEGLGILDDLQYLNVSYNRLCGKIPMGGRLSSFNASYVHNKCLCGSPLQVYN